MGPPALEVQVLLDFRLADYTARPIKQIGCEKTLTTKDTKYHEGFSRMRFLRGTSCPLWSMR